MSAVAAEFALDVRDCVRKICNKSLDDIGVRCPAAEYLGRSAQWHGRDVLAQHIPGRAKCVQPSLLAIYRARLRAPPPAVPEKRERSDFDCDVDYKQYVSDRRRAKEREREFNRPKRDRSNRDQTGRDQRGRTRPARVREQRELLQRRCDELEAKETARMVRMGIIVPVGRKKAPRVV